MSDSLMSELNVRLERGVYVIRTIDGESYVVSSFADPEGRAYLGINGGALEPVIIGTNKVDGPAHEWTEPVVACEREIVAVRQNFETFMSSTVTSIAPLGADATSQAVLSGDAFAHLERSAHWV